MRYTQLGPCKPGRMFAAPICVQDLSDIGFVNQHSAIRRCESRGAATMLERADCCRLAGFGFG